MNDDHRHHRPSSVAVAVGTHTSSSTRLLSSALSSLLEDDTLTQKLLLLTFEKVIDAGVPALFFILSTWWVLSMVRGGGGGGGAGGSSGSIELRGSGAGAGGTMRGGRRGKGMRGGRRGRDIYLDADDRPSLGPVEELYDDIYDDLAGSTGDDGLPPIFKLFRGMMMGGQQQGRGGRGRGKGGRGGGATAFDGPTSKLNIGIPKQTYLKVTKLNSRYDSYRYSMIEATRGKAIAASELRASGFQDALYKAVGISSSSPSIMNAAGGLTLAESTALLTLERDFLTSGSKLVSDVAALNRAIMNAAIVFEMDDMGIAPGSLDKIIEAEIVNDHDQSTEMVPTTIAQKDFFGITDDIAAGASMKTATTKTKEDHKISQQSHKKPSVTVGERVKIEKQSDIMRAVKEVESINTDIMLLELDFVRSVVEVLGPDRADAIRTAIVGNIIGGEVGTLLRTLKERPLATVLSSLVHAAHDSTMKEMKDNYQRKNLYVTRFPGDVTASQLNELREEVTGILRSATPGDEALLVLQSGGGTVTGYGLAAAQLQRFKAKDMKLTVCVEQVAASGGYMMCCTADRIVASPFAVLGSIGVISEIPNAYERLQREGIEFQTITAGKFKRTVTPTKKITREDIKKSEADIAEIFNLFKGFVKSQRPQLDIDSVATGETWFGEDALARGLCDELGTADDVLLDFIDNGYNVYEVAYKPTKVGIGLLAGLSGESSPTSDDALGGLFGGWRSALRSVVRGIMSDVKDEVVAELSSSMNDMNSIERRYMAQDDTFDKIRMKD